MLNGVGVGNYVPTPVDVPVYVDGPCNEWWQYYGASPNCAYLVDTTGVLFAFHQWFNNSNPPEGPPTNIWCDIDSLLDVESGNCTEITSTNGTFSFEIQADSDHSVTGDPGDILDSFGMIINTSNEGVEVRIERVMNNLPSTTWSSSMCITQCLLPEIDTVSAIIGAGDTIDFSMHFYTDPLMPGPDTAMARIRFTNVNGNQQPIHRNFRGMTRATASGISEAVFNTGERTLNRVTDVLGRECVLIPNRVLIHHFDDGTARKVIVIE